MSIALNRLLDNTSKRSTLYFFVFITLLSIVFALAIYFREAAIKDQIAPAHVLIWQLSIWSPWVLIFYLLPKVRVSVENNRYKDVLYYGSGFIWVCLHCGWFFFISSNYSPYLGKPATGYGVYPYFFIFWALIDLIIIIGLIAYIRYTERPDNSVIKAPEITLIEVTRGREVFFCEPHDIHWLSAVDNHTVLHTIHGKFVMRKTLKYYYEHINSNDFIQIHRSTIVNVRHVKGLTKSHNNLCVMLKDGTKKNVSKKNQPRIRSIFKDQML